MDKEATQQTLQRAYQVLSTAFSDRTDVASQLSPPLLLSVTDTYLRSKGRILVVGQETLGWGWNSRLQDDYPEYSEGWPHEDITSWADFARQADGVANLCRGYELFEFARYQPRNRRSPFWTAFREVAEWPEAGVMWTNLYKADYEGRAMASAPPEVRQAMMALDKRVLAEELAILKPDVCIFFTGPNYDEAISERFPQVEQRPIADDRPVRELARLIHESLPEHSYRLYHPRWLRRQGKWDDIGLVRNQIISDR